MKWIQFSPELQMKALMLSKSVNFQELLLFCLECFSTYSPDDALSNITLQWAGLITEISWLTWQKKKCHTLRCTRSINLSVELS